MGLEDDSFKVECPTCGAPIGAGCHTVGAVTRKMRTIHKARRFALIKKAQNALIKVMEG